MKLVSPLYVMLFGLIAFGLVPAMGGSWESFSPEWAIKQGNEVYEYMPFNQVELAPEVCIMIPPKSLIDYYDYQDEIWYGIGVWEEGLNEMSAMFNPDKGYSWQLNIKEYDMEENYITNNIQCNIFIVFTGFNEEEPDTIGVTNFDYANSRHKYAVITVYSIQNQKPADINITPNPEDWIDSAKVFDPINVNTMRQIVAHEMGHALGLGHYYAGLNNPSRSIMEASMSTWYEINYLPPQYLDYYALLMKYGTDGFKIWEYPIPEKWFIPPHPKIHA